MPPNPGRDYTTGRSTFEVTTLAEFVEALVAIPQPGFYARGEPREYAKPWLPCIWRDDHKFQNKTPIAEPEGFYTQGELEAVKQCQSDLKNGVFEDIYFKKFFKDIDAEISLNSVDLLYWTALAQHYNEGQRYPTRLLDVTTDAFVALFFAVNSSTKEDGFVFWTQGNCNDLSHLPGTETTGVFLDVLKVKATDGGSQYHPKDNTPNYIRPPFPNKRLEAQRGAFLWIRALDERIPESSLILRIPAQAKPKLLLSLEYLNYSQKTMFPI